jgi:hypothetical protein
MSSGPSTIGINKPGQNVPTGLGSISQVKFALQLVCASSGKVLVRIARYLPRIHLGKAQQKSIVNFTFYKFSILVGRVTGH